MSAYEKAFTDLDRAIDGIRSIPDEWSPQPDDDEPDEETIRCTCLALHEWIANLHQYADFKDRTPSINIRLFCKDRSIVCSVVDNSEGFDLEAHLPSEDDNPEPLPERGMGLRIIDACAESLSYTATDAGRQRFEFLVSFDHDPWLNTLF